jgi:hypothetical protein
VVTLNVRGAALEEEPLSDEMELLEAVILNCRRVGEFRILSSSITSEQARIVSQFCIRGRNCTAIRKKSRFQSWCKLEVFRGLLMEEVSFYFLFNKTNRCTNFPILFLSRNSTCFRQFLCPKHVEFLDKNKFGKLVRLLVLLKRNLLRCMVT